MPTNDRIIVGIDVGTHKVCTIVAEADPGPGNRLNVLGVGAVASEGIAKGMVTDIVAASKSIEHSLEAAERQSGCRILSAYVSISGNHISSMNNRGLVAVSNPDRIISQEDVNRAVDAASAVAIPAGRDPLHIIPRTYTIDGQDGIRNPVGMSGFRLDVETHIVTAAANVRENLIRCVQKADVEVDDLVLSPLAAAESVLTEQEKNMGVVLVDIGHGTTDVAIYVEGTVWRSKVLPVGGWHLTNDLVIVFNIPYEAAEALKLQYGQAAVPGTNLYSAPQRSQPVNGKSHPAGSNAPARVAGDAPDLPPQKQSAIGLMQSDLPIGPFSLSGDEILEAQTFEGSTRLISRGDLNEVMAARLDQLFGMVGDEIRRSDYEGLLPAGVVLVGGVANMPGIEALASNKLRMPVRIGRPQRIGGLADAFESPEYATTAGLTLWGMKQSAQAHSYLPHRRTAQRNGGDSAKSKLASWLKGFLPQS
ncbi:MAG: cell division protein FtsA [Chloroflexia bacterium]